MKKLKQIIVILIYLFFIFCGSIYLYPEYGKKFDEITGYNFSEVLIMKIELAGEQIKGYKSGFDSTIDNSAPNTEGTLEERIDNIENAN